MKANDINVIVTTTFKIELTEEEGRALKAITSYGVTSFLEMFYKHLGANYLQPHEKGVDSLFEGIRKNLSPKIAQLDAFKKNLSELKGKE